MAVQFVKVSLCNFEFAGNYDPSIFPSQKYFLQKLLITLEQNKAGFYDYLFPKKQYKPPETYNEPFPWEFNAIPLPAKGKTPQDPS